MKITYKLVGTKQQLNIIKDIERKNLNHSNCVKDIKEYGYTGSFEKIIFICRSKKLIDDSIQFKGTFQQVFVFSQDTTVKIQLLEVFKQHGISPIIKETSHLEGRMSSEQVSSIREQSSNFTVLPQQNLKKPIEQKPKSLEDDEMIQHNESVIKTLSDPDFITLMRIYRHKTDLLSTAFNYVNSGNLVDDNNISNVEIDSLNEKEQQVFDQVNQMITGFKFKTDSSLLNKLVRHFKGNVSLIFRYIYQENLNED
tara:strand:- start:3192 stop:3953 length:762 start_codon:yes stop_codon:yes gene_type:complete